MGSIEVAGAGVSEEVVAFHSSLSRSAREFLDYVDRNPECCEASRFRSLDVRTPFLRYPLQGWPILVSDEVMARIRRASVDVCELFRRVPDLAFDSDPRRMRAYYGYDTPFWDLVVEVLRDRQSVQALLSRGDFVLTDDGMKCLELNASSYLGGWESATWTEMVLAVPEIRRFLDGRDTPYRYANTAEAFFRHTVSRAYDALLFDDELNMAFAFPPGQRRAGPIEGYGTQMLHEAVRAVAGHGRGSLYFCRYGELRESMGCLFLDGKRIHVLVEQYQGEIVPDVFRCALRGSLHLYNGLAAVVFADKRNLALLSELGGSDRLTAEERDLVARHIPWTRELEAGKTRYEGSEVDLPDLLLTARERMVLKRALGAQGTDVFIGAAEPPEAWAAQVRSALEDEAAWVVQERCVSRPYLAQHGESGHAPHDVVWGLFVFGDDCPGGFLRMLPQERMGVVNASRGAVEGVIIEMEEDPSNHPTTPKEVVP